MFFSNLIQKTVRKKKEGGVDEKIYGCRPDPISGSCSAPKYGILAFVAEITHNDEEKILGNLYELDFGQHSKHVDRLLIK